MAAGDFGSPSSGNLVPRMPLTTVVRRYFVIIAALLRREALLRIHSPLGSLLAIGEPTLMLLAWGIPMMLLWHRPPYGPSIMLFLATGFFPYYLFVRLSTRLWIDNPARRFAIEKPLDHAFVSTIMAVIEYAIFGFGLFASLYFLASPLACPTYALPLLGSLALTVTMGFGVGLTNVIIRKFAPWWGIIYSGLIRVGMIFSGIHVVVDTLPPEYRSLMSYNPILHMVELARLGFYPRYPHATLDVRYLVWSAIFAAFFGLVLERALRRRTEKL